MMMRANATPALARVSSSFLMQVLVAETQTIPVNAPLEGTGDSVNGVYYDRTENTNVLWYVPAYSLAADPDPAFAFTATQSGQDENGSPYFVGQLTLSLTKSISPGAQAFMARFGGAAPREIPIDGIVASLHTTYKDENGTNQIRSLAGKVARDASGNLILTFDNILGRVVVSLYQDLVMLGGASVVLSGNYTLWRQVAQPPPPPSPPPPSTQPPPIVRDHRPGPIRRYAVRPAFTAAPGRVAAAPSMVMATSFRPAAVNATQTVQRAYINPRILEVPPHMQPPAPPKPDYQRVTTPTVLNLSLEKKYAGSQYSLLFKVNDGASTRPIINVNDLSAFNIRQSEFKQLMALGDINQRHESLSRAYIGVLSKTIVVIPSRYVIARSTAALDCECFALVDSASSGASKCKFQFSMVIAPDISPIDLLQFSQEIASNPDLKGYTLRLPSFLKDESSPKIQTAFHSSADCLPTSIPKAFSLVIQVRDDENGSPAVANANILIKQLCLDQEPFLAGSIALKLDDFYPDPVEAKVILNFHRSAGDPSEVSFVLNEAAQTVDVANHSAFDLRVPRYALCNASAINVVNVDQLVKKGENFQLPLPSNHDALTVLLDRQTAYTGAVSKNDIGPFMKFETVDVQTMQYMIGVNATPVKFDVRGISQIDVSVVLADLPNVAVPVFSLVNQRKVNQTNVVIPLQMAINELKAILTFTIHHVDAQIANSVFTFQHEFIDEPIMILNDSDLS